MGWRFEVRFEVLKWVECAVELEYVVPCVFVGLRRVLVEGEWLNRLV